MTRSLRLFCGAAIVAFAAGASPAGATTARPDPTTPATGQATTPDPSATPADQVAPAGSALPATAATGNQQGDIIVTATKREESVQDVPISMSVVTGQTLSDFQATDVKSIQNLVPNVFVEQTAGNDVIYIRGFGSPPANFSFDQSVSLYMDGVYAGRLRQAQAPFFDVGRVEVLRGPQGALFGKNTAAGAISIVSAGPTQTLSAGLNGVYNFDQKGFDLSGFVSGPVSSTLGVRMAVRIQDQDGWIRNLANPDFREPRTRMQMFRTTLRWAPTSTFDTTAKIEYVNLDRRGGLNVSGSLVDPQRAGLTRYSVDSPLGREGLTNRSLLISNTANLELGDFTLTSVSGYSWFDGNVVNDFDQRTLTGAVVANSVYNSYPEHFRQLSQEVRLLSPAGRTLEFIVGAYYDNQHYHLDQLGGFNIAALNYFGLLHTIFNQQSHTASVFGQGTLNITPQFRVIGSLRYSDTYKHGDFGGRLEYGPFAIRPVNTTANQSFSEGNTDPSGTVQFDITPDVMVYAVYGRGSKSGGFVSNTYGTTDATFRYRPERSRNYEGGIKFAFLNHAVVGNVAVYDTQFRDLQVSVYNPTISTYQTGNAASATSKGVEGSVTIRPFSNFDITANGAYQDIKYDNYPGAACLATQPITVCNPASPASIAANNLAGYRPAYTSRWTGSVQAHARVVPSDALKVDITGIAAGRSGFFDSDNQSPIFGYQRGFVKYDLRLQLADRDDRWHVAVVGKNLTSEITTGSAFNLPAPITSIPRAILYTDPPRSVAVEVGVRY